MRSLLLAFLTVLVAINSFLPDARAQVTAEQVREAIDRGVAWMKNQQQPNGNWGEVIGYPGGMTSLCTLALLNCGVSPDDPSIKKALNYLRSVESQKTYVVALQTMVFCRATPERDARLIRRNVKWLEDVQIRAEPYQGRRGSGSVPRGARPPSRPVLVRTPGPRRPWDASCGPTRRRT